jgi:DNA repair protein RadA/Sms
VSVSKKSTQFVCGACAAIFPRWMGRCTSCNAWNTLVEEIAPKRSVGGGPASAARSSAGGGARPLAEIDGRDASMRIQTGIGELDRVLGGGAVLGGVTLVGGDPGVGKSTLLLQALAGLVRGGHRALYVSGEESAGQIAARARRLGCPEDGELLVLADGDLGAVERAIEETRPSAVVLDSVQTIRSADLESAAGTVAQLREVAARMVDRAKRERVAAFLVGHVTKDGALAGPKVLEHLVDTVLAFEGERGHAFRTLRAQKNRYGSATEVGVFEMSGEGLVEVKSPSALFLAERPAHAPGSVICATSEGTRPMLVEVQALVSAFSNGSGRRTANGVDGSRLALLLAVLDRKAGLAFGACDVFVNIAGGLRIDEPAVDLAVALSLASSLRDRAVPADLVAFGEIGLAGEVRSVPRTPARLAEAAQMGFRRAIVPRSERVDGDGGSRKAPLEVLPVRTLAEALELIG